MFPNFVFAYYFTAVKYIALASALQKLESIGKKVPMNGNPAFEPVLIMNTFSGSGLQSLFRTHPPTADRLRQLQEIARQQQQKNPTFAVN